MEWFYFYNTTTWLTLLYYNIMSPSSPHLHPAEPLLLSLCLSRFPLWCDTRGVYSDNRSNCSTRLVIRTENCILFSCKDSCRFTYLTLALADPRTAMKTVHMWCLDSWYLTLQTEGKKSASSAADDPYNMWIQDTFIVSAWLLGSAIVLET